MAFPETAHLPPPVALPSALSGCLDNSQNRVDTAGNPSTIQAGILTVSRYFFQIHLGTLTAPIHKDMTQTFAATPPICGCTTGPPHTCIAINACCRYQRKRCTAGQELIPLHPLMQGRPVFVKAIAFFSFDKWIGPATNSVRSSGIRLTSSFHQTPTTPNKSSSSPTWHNHRHLYPICRTVITS